LQFPPLQKFSRIQLLWMISICGNVTHINLSSQGSSTKTLWQDLYINNMLST
jgi:hypothetical protein